MKKKNKIKMLKIYGIERVFLNVGTKIISFLFLDNSIHHPLKFSEEKLGRLG